MTPGHKRQTRGLLVLSRKNPATGKSTDSHTLADGGVRDRVSADATRSLFGHQDRGHPHSTYPAYESTRHARARQARITDLSGASCLDGR